MDTSNPLLQVITMTLPMVAGRVDERGVVREAIGGALLSDCGLEESQLLGIDLFELCPEIAGHLQLALGGGSVHFSWSGQIGRRHCVLENFFFFDLTRRGGAIFLARDVTETHQIERALAETRRQYRTVLDRSPDAILLLDGNNQCVEANQAAVRLLAHVDGAELVGRSLGELLGVDPGSLAAPTPDGVSPRQTSPETPDGNAHQVSAVCRDGESRDLEYALHAVSGGLRLCIMRDVSLRRDLEEQILNANELVQRRLGQDLHDGLGQHLTGVGLLTQLLENQLNQQGLEENARQAGYVSDLIQQAVIQMRHLARSLFPMELEDRNLPAALGHLAATVEKTYGLRCEVEVAPQIEIADPETATHLYRITQEAVNNARRHGGARQITVRLSPWRDAALVLSVQDDGKGFSVGQHKARPDPGMGLRAMRYRSGLLNGRLKVLSGPGRGTTVCCVVPRP